MSDDSKAHEPDRGVLVPRQGHAPPPDRLWRGERRRARRHHAGAGALAGRLRPGQALQDRHAAAAVGRRRRRRQDGAGRHRRWRSTASTGPGGINGRPIELIVADYESKPDVGRRKAEKLVVEDKVDAHVGGFLSNVCLACMPVFEEHKIVNMISVCLDTTHHHHQVQPLQLPAVRLRAGAGGGVRALPRRQDGQEVAHRLSPTTPGASRRATPTPSRSRRPAARWSAPPASRSAPPT